MSGITAVKLKPPNKPGLSGLRARASEGDQKSSPRLGTRWIEGWVCKGLLLL